MGKVSTTFKYKEVDLDIIYNYSPAEKRVENYGDGTGHPGCEESIEVESITHAGDCMMELLEDNKEEIEGKLLDKTKEDYD